MLNVPVLRERVFVALTQPALRLFSQASERVLRVHSLPWVAPKEPVCSALLGPQGSTTTGTELRILGFLRVCADFGH